MTSITVPRGAAVDGDRVWAETCVTVRAHGRDSVQSTVARARATGVVRVLVTVLAVLLGSLIMPVEAVPASTAATASVTLSSPSSTATAATAANRAKKVVLTPTESTWTSARQPQKVMSRTPALAVSKREDHAYLKFDGSASAGKNIVSAKLRLKVRRTNATEGGVRVHPTSAAWSAATLSYDNRPRQQSRTLNSKLRMAPPGKWVSIPLRNVKKALSKGSLAFRLSFSHPSSRSMFGKAGRAAPVLVVKMTDEPTDDGDNKVFAHYFPPYPVSIDNAPPANDYYARNYLTINGENGKHRAYGGLLRDRPIGRSPLPGNWRVTDLRTEIRQAKSAGIDGFTVDILSLKGTSWDVAQNLMKAADAEGGFEVIPQLDAAASGTKETPGQTAAALSRLLDHASAQVIGGKYVLSAFAAENTPVAWWKELISSLERSHKLPIKFIPIFVNPSDANMKAFAPISYGFGSWGSRTAQGAAAGPNYAAKAHAMGKTWMQAVAVQDARPRSGSYAEASNTETLRATWTRAIRDGADFVQMATWNDYSESTSFAPSVSHGQIFLAISAHYIEWFSEGSPPAITADHLYLTHRSHHWGAKTTSGIENMQPTLGGSNVPPRDTVEALVFLTAPATVTVTSGINSKTVSLPAGISAVLVPLAAGTPSASISRGSTTVKTVTSPYSVTLTPERQDMQYFASGS